VLTHGHYARNLAAETARWSTITQICEGTNQIQRVVMAVDRFEGFCGAEPGRPGRLSARGPDASAHGASRLAAGE
jgi:hypothetical protein